ADAQHVALVDHDRLGIAAQGVPGLIIGHAVVGADHGVAVVLQAVAALLALAAAVDDAAHAHQVAGLEAGDPGADLGHPADDLVSRHAGEQRAGPFRPHLVQVGVADAAVGDVD